MEIHRILVKGMEKGSHLDVLSKFDSLFGRREVTPTYREVRKVDRDLFDEIMDRFGGYRVFLRRFHLPLPPTSKREKAFIEYSRKSSLRYHNNHWSRLELEFKDLLGELGYYEWFDYIHDCEVPSKYNRLYKLDFYFYRLNKNVEVDGIFHKYGNSKRRDKEKDEWLLATYEIKTLRVTSEMMRDKEKVMKVVYDFLR